MLCNIYYLYIAQLIPQKNIIELAGSIAILIYMIWTWIYIIMFAARMLESAIEGQLVNRSDALKGCFCLLFFPIGVWYIQPAVQRVLNKYNSTNETNY